MARRRFTKDDRARIFTANDGCCHLCGGKIDGVREAWEVEHVIAWEFTRDGNTVEPQRITDAIAKARDKFGYAAPALSPALTAAREALEETRTDLRILRDQITDAAKRDPRWDNMDARVDRWIARNDAALALLKEQTHG